MSFYSVYFQIRVVKQVGKPRSGCLITLTTIQQLKFLGQILRTEKDESANIYAFRISPTTGEQLQRDRRSPFPNHVQEWIDTNKHFLEDNVVPTTQDRASLRRRLTVSCSSVDS